MGDVNGALKKCFIVWNIILALAGAALFVLTAIAHASVEEVDQNMLTGCHFTYGLASVSITISLLGIYGAYKEKKWPLAVFLTVVILGCVGLLVIAVPSAIAHYQMDHILTNYFRSIVPLNKTEAQGRNFADHLQSELKCCGFFEGYRDWGTEVPDSCLCPENYNPGECEVIGKYVGEEPDTLSRSTPHPDAGKRVYSQICLPLFVNFVKMVFNVTLALVFGFLVLGVVGVSLCSAIIHQMRVPRAHEGPIIFSINSKGQKYRELKHGVND